MATPVESANLLLKLYELRREPVMREARNTIFGFNPASAEEYMQAMMGPNSAHIRMVTSYWEMACSFVANGAIDAKMFDETNGEHFMIFGKLEPILPQLRQMFGPQAFVNLEKVCVEAPGGMERVRAMRERMKAVAAQMQQRSTASAS
jgi:hypothetical protein